MYYVVQFFFLKVMEIFVFRFKKIFDELKKQCILETLGYLTNYFSIFQLKSLLRLVLRSFSDNDDITYFFKLSHDVMMKIFPFHPFVINFLKLAKEDFIFSTSFLILGQKCYF